MSLDLQWQPREKVHVIQQLYSRFRLPSKQHVAGTRGHATHAYRSADLPAAPPLLRLGPRLVCLQGSMRLGVHVSVGSICTGCHVGYLPARTTNNAAPCSAELESLAEHTSRQLGNWAHLLAQLTCGCLSCSCSVQGTHPRLGAT